MARDDDDIDYEDEDEDEENGGFFRWLQMVVVLCALGGFFGLAWYAYKSGDNVDEKDVELVKNDKNPIKEAPADPGGMQIPNQDKTVYSLINGNKTDKPVVERILPPTEEPIQHKSDTETWMNEKVKNKNAAGKDGQKSKQFAPTTTTPLIKEAEQEKPKEKASETAVQPVLAQDAPEIAQNTQASDAVAAVKKPVVNAPAPAKVPAKETVKQEEPADQDQPEAEEEPKAEAAPAKMPKARIQLGAFKSEAEANQDWTKIAKKFPDELGDKQHYVVHVVIKGKNFYRLQAAPFASAKEAEQLCVTLVSSDQGCFLAKDK